eukprot:NODE_1023_length_2588_cov_0.371635.p5 type:complete len:115 gc:universal NODE_1023_length_2588_cov_0.371635:1876-2220(+)
MLLSLSTISALTTFSNLEEPFKIIEHYSFDKSMDVYCITTKWTKNMFCRKYLQPKEWFKMQFVNVEYMSLHESQICGLTYSVPEDKNNLPGYVTKCITIHGKFNGKKDAAQVPK